MTDSTFSEAVRPSARTLISWSAVLVGAVVAVAVGAMLNLLGVALGASAFNPYDFDGGEVSEFTAAAGMWMAFANALALFVGAAVATRATRQDDQHKGALHGLAVWALAFLLAITIASAAGAGSAAAVLGGKAQDEAGRGGVAVDYPPSRVIEGELIQPAPLPPTPAETEEAADTTAMLALWGFLTMLVGAIAAVFGGLYGGRKHRWIDKAVDGHRDDRPDDRRDVRRPDVLRPDARDEAPSIIR